MGLCLFYPILPLTPNSGDLPFSGRPAQRFRVAGVSYGERWAASALYTLPHPGYTMLFSCLLL